jgi:hypothetical protein
VAGLTIGVGVCPSLVFIMMIVANRVVIIIAMAVIVHFFTIVV